MAVVQGVGYANPNFSHFRSTDIWQSALPDGYTDTGWLGRFLDSAMVGQQQPAQGDQHRPAAAQGVLGQAHPGPRRAEHRLLPLPGSAARHRRGAAGDRRLPGQLRRPGGRRWPIPLAGAAGDSAAYQATIQLAKAATAPRHAQYPASNALASQLKLVSQIIATNLGTRVFMVTQGGYDDHAQEANAHPRLMAELGDAIAAFYQDLAGQNRANQVMMMTFSEFGRRPLENASNGTDHGTAAPMFVIGGAVKGGLYGQQPSLSDLDNGNLKYTTDFRSVYSTVLANWHGRRPHPGGAGQVPDPQLRVISRLFGPHRRPRPLCRGRGRRIRASSAVLWRGWVASSHTKKDR